MKLLSNLNRSMLDKMVHLLQNPEALLNEPLPVKEKFESLAYVDAQIRKYPKLSSAARAIMNNPINPVSRTTAYQLIREAQYIYGSTSVFSKPYYKEILIQKALEVLDHCQRNNRIKDFNLTMQNLIKLFGFDQQEKDAITADMLKQHQFLVMVNFKNSQESYTLDVSKLDKLSVEERMKLMTEVESENIEFDMIKKIEEEEANE